MTIEDHITRSNTVVRDLVWPEIKPMMCELLDIVDADLHIVQGGPLAELLDQNAGIDAIIKSGSEMWGLACRVQYDGRDWQTFTIRSRTAYGNTETELHKRSASVASGTMGPKFTLQAYTQNGTVLLSAAITRTDVLIGLQEHQLVTTRTNWSDQSTFLVVPWAIIPPDDIRILCIPF